MLKLLTNRVLLFVIFGMIVAAFGGFVYIFSDIVLYFVISMILAALLKPFTNTLAAFRISKIYIPRALAVALSFLMLLAIIGSLVALFAPLVTRQLEALNALDFETEIKKVEKPIMQAERWLIKHKYVSAQRGFLRKAVEDNSRIEVKQTDVSAIVNNVISMTSNFFISVLAVTFITFFLLYDRGILKRRFLAFIPNAYFELTIAASYKIEKLLSNYLIGLFLQIFSIFTLTATGLSAIGLPYAITVAVFAAVINIIPFIGPLVGSVFAIIVALSTSPEPIDTEIGYVYLILSIGAVSLTVHLIDNIILQPLIFSKSVKAHPLEIFVAIFAGAALAGILGMIIAIPVYTIIRVAITEFYDGYQKYKIFRLNNFG